MSTPIVIRDFSVIRDFRNIKWGATIWYNLLRAISAGLVLGILMFIFPQQHDDRMTALSGPLVWPFAYLFIFLPFGMVLSLIGNIIPIFKVFAALIALMAVTIGDPVVCIIQRFFPKAVPMPEPPLLSFSVIHWVFDAPVVTIIR